MYVGYLKLLKNVPCFFNKPQQLPCLLVISSKTDFYKHQTSISLCVPDFFYLTTTEPRMRFPCLGLYPIIHAFNLSLILVPYSMHLFHFPVNMHYMCGRETSAEQFTEWKGGFLLFDSNLLPSDHDLECNITLHIGAYSSVYSPGIVFSFSEWEMDFPDCDRNNLTIVEGDWRQSTGYPRRSIRGKAISSGGVA